MSELARILAVVSKGEAMDESQRAALEVAKRGGVSIIGAPGSGKTAVLMEIVARLARGRVAFLTQDRRAADKARQALTRRLGGRGENLSIQTVAAFSYGLVATFAAAVNRPAPELLSGPDEDALLREILADPAAPVSYPDFAASPEVRALPGFRSQLRNLITRSAELGIGAEELIRLGRTHPELGVTAQLWITGGQLRDVYSDLVALEDATVGSADRLDHAQLLATAASVLQDWEERTARVGQGAAPVPRWDWVLVDDLQNAPRSLLPLLRVLQKDGARIITAGNPDQAVQGFRGGVAALPGEVTRPAPVGLGLEPAYLSVRHRGGAALSAVVRELEAHLPVSGAVGHQRSADVAEGDDDHAGGVEPVGVAPDGRAYTAGRTHGLAAAVTNRPGPAPAQESVEVALFANPEEELAWIAATLRRSHLRGTPYASMAVISRSATSHAHIRETLVRRGILVARIASQLPLRANSMVAALLATINVALSEEHEPAAIAAMLTSPLIGMDPLEVKRLGRQARARALAAREENDRTALPDAEELLAAAILGGDTAWHPELARVGRIVESVRQTARESNSQAEQVLWAAWQGAGVAEKLQRRAMESGPEADTAGRHLDAVIQLFRVTQRLADRDPNVTFVQLRDLIAEQDLPEDTVARLGAEGDAVQLATPASCQGAEWDVVVLQGLQDGVWPNPRVRDPLAGTGMLTALVTGRCDEAELVSAAGRGAAAREVISDELRQFLHAASRAARRLILTAVDGEGATPSRFLGLVAGGAGGSDAVQHPRAVVDLATPTALVSQIRRSLSLPGPHPAELAAALDILRGAQIVEADPTLWLDELRPSTVQGRPREAGAPPLSFSPSQAEKMVTRPVAAFTQFIGAEDTRDSEPFDRGNAIHGIAQWYGECQLTHATPSAEEFVARVRATFPEDARYVAGLSAQKSRDMAALLYSILANPADRLRGVETSLTGTLQASAEPLTARARADRIVERADGAHILDFKTGHVDADVQNNPQLLFYQLLYELATGKPAAGAELVELGNVAASPRSQAGVPTPEPAAGMTFGVPKQRSRGALSESDRERAVAIMDIIVHLLRSGWIPALPVLDHGNKFRSGDIDLDAPKEWIFS